MKSESIEKLVSGQVEEFLKQRELKSVSEDGCFVVPVRLQSGTYVVRVHADENSLAVILRAQQNVPEDRRRAIAELQGALNLHLRWGGFRLDMTDGEVLFVLAFPADAGISFSVVERAFEYSLAVFERFMPAMLGVCFGQVSPEDAARAFLGEAPDADEEHADQSQSGPPPSRANSGTLH